MAAKIYVCDNCGFLFTRTGECDQCPDCGKKIQVFGKSHLEDVAKEFDLPILARLPIDPKMAECYDSGLMETVDTALMDGVIEAIENV